MQSSCSWCFDTGLLSGDPDEIECDCMATMFYTTEERVALCKARTARPVTNEYGEIAP